MLYLTQRRAHITFAKHKMYKEILYNTSILDQEIAWPEKQAEVFVHYIAFYPGGG